MQLRRQHQCPWHCRRRGTQGGAMPQNLSEGNPGEPDGVPESAAAALRDASSDLQWPECRRDRLRRGLSLGELLLPHLPQVLSEKPGRTAEVISLISVCMYTEFWTGLSVPNCVLNHPETDCVVCHEDAWGKVRSIEILFWGRGAHPCFKVEQFLMNLAENFSRRMEHPTLRDLKNSSF